jgi:hypothetical protein
MSRSKRLLGPHRHGLLTAPVIVGTAIDALVLRKASLVYSSIVEFPSCVWLLTTGNSSMDSRKYQTSTATPAEPGGLPLTLVNRVDLQRAQERSVQELSPAEMERIAGAAADRLIKRAQKVRVTERREVAAT